MCEKLRYCAREIDPCISKEVEELQRQGLNTILSCCGHGKYPKTIVVRNGDDSVVEIISNTHLKPYNPKFDKRHNPYYKKDSEGYYYIPKVEENST